MSENGILCNTNNCTRDKNYFQIPIPPSDHENYYLKLIQEMKDYSKRCYTFEKINENDVPFPIIFILNLLTRFPSGMTSDNDSNNKIGFKSSKFRLYLAQYTEHYYLQNYKPNDIPLLYVLILDFIGNRMQKLGVDGSLKEIKYEGIRYHQLAVKYYMRHILIEDTHLTNFFTKRIQLTHLSMFKGHTLNQMTSFSVDLCHRTFTDVDIKTIINQRKIDRCQIYRHALFLMNESFNHFVVHHKDYSIYDRDGDDYCSAPFVFVSEMIRRLIQRDIPRKECSKYQKRYKYLLQISLKTYGKYIGQISERYGLYNVYLGYYYAIFCYQKHGLKALQISRKLLYKGINMIRNYNKYQQSLSEIYIFAQWLERGLCNLDDCINVTKMSIELYTHYNLPMERKGEELDLEELEKTKKSGKILSKKECGQQFWEDHINTRKQKGAPIFSQWCISSWFYYFKNDESYQIMKNICSLKECNYSKCRTKKGKLKKCSRCKSVYYCCENHQKRDWKIKHRIECQMFNKRNPSLTLRNSIERWGQEQLWLSECGEEGYLQLIDVPSA
eukprot:301218_1